MAQPLTDVYVLSRTEWARMERLAAEKDAISDQAGWTRRWNPQFNLLGTVAEWLFALLYGLEQKAGFGDGGFDYGVVDVKGTSHFYQPRLLRPRDEAMNAEYYALIAVDLKRHCARYVGYADRTTVLTSKVVDYGNGPTYTLFAEELTPALPPLVKENLL